MNTESVKNISGAPWDTGTNPEFFEYYEEASLSPRTLERFTAVRDNILRILGQRGETEHLDVADIGCGAGAGCHLWASLGHRVHGLDINEPLIQLARERAREAGFPIEFDVGSATRLPWPDMSMDVCVAPELLEHVRDWEACLDEFVRVLKPGGALYISTSNWLCPQQQEFNLPFYSWYPPSLKHRYERLAVSTRPEIANHAKYPAVNWFSYYSLKKALAFRGVDILDRFDMMNMESKSHTTRILVDLIRKVPPLRFAGHVATPYTVVLGFKDN